MAKLEEIRAARAEDPKLRDRDLADRLGVSEAALFAADIGRGVTRIAAHPHALVPRLLVLGRPTPASRSSGSGPIRRRSTSSARNGAA